VRLVQKIGVRNFQVRFVLLTQGALSVVLMNTQPAVSAEMYVDKNNIHINGPIVPGDYNKFRKLLRTTAGTKAFLSGGVTLDSTGGSVSEAMLMGQLLQLNLTQVFVPKEGHCFSACFLLLASGRYPAGSSSMGVHRMRPAAADATIADTQRLFDSLGSRVDEYLRKMGVPSKIIERMNETPPSDLFTFNTAWLVQNELLRAFMYRPALLDVVEAKCGRDPIDQGSSNWLDCMEEVRIANRLADIPEIQRLIRAK
jgi:hypothetical protein